MNDQLQEALVGIIGGVTNATGKATTFLIEEIPDVLEQLLMWKMAESAITCAIGLIIGIAIAVFATQFFNKVTEEWQKSYSTSGFDYVILAVGNLAGGMVVIISFNTTWLQIWLAPKVYLIEYAATLASK